MKEANPDQLVTCVEYGAITPAETPQCRWVTDFTVTTTTVCQIMRGGRARWQVENETVTTLTNQGSHCEHNCGPGNKNLSVVLALLRMLALLVDQTQPRAGKRFQSGLQKDGRRSRLWAHRRALFYTLAFTGMEDIDRALLSGFRAPVVLLGPP